MLHHAEILVRDLVHLYDAVRSGAPVTLPELAVQYADYAVWQRSFFTEAVLRDGLDWFVERLRGVPMLALPSDRARPSVQSFRGGSVPIELAVELGARLAEFCRSEAVTPFMTLLAALEALMQRYSGQDEFAIGFPSRAARAPKPRR